jgi:hypothetical protein
VGAGGGPLVPGFVAPGTLNFPQNQPFVYNDPVLGPTGVVGRFNYLDHWYGLNTLNGGLGHWYPNGRANGRGVLGFGSGYGYGGLYSGGGTLGGLTAGPAGGGTSLGPGAGAGGFGNQFRR